MLKKISIALAVFLISGLVQAASITNVYISGYTPYASGNVLLTVSGSPPSNVCNYWGRHFRFNIESVGGKMLYAELMTAYRLGTKISISYNASPTPGTYHNSGCETTTMALVWAITPHK